jgi:hypothetical protein
VKFLIEDGGGVGFKLLLDKWEGAGSMETVDILLKYFGLQLVEDKRKGKR